MDDLRPDRKAARPAAAARRSGRIHAVPGAGLSIAAVVAAAVCVLPCAPPLLAHHSFAAEFDADKPITLTGTVTKVEWTNPHVHFSIAVKGAGGSVTEWRFEGYPPNMLVRQGWTRNVTLKPGDAVTVFGWRARAEPNLGAAREITFADGRKMAAGPPAGTGGQ
jgi:hypothetical protein